MQNSQEEARFTVRNSTARAGYNVPIPVAHLSSKDAAAMPMRMKPMKVAMPFSQAGQMVARKPTSIHVEVSKRRMSSGSSNVNGQTATHDATTVNGGMNMTVMSRAKSASPILHSSAPFASNTKMMVNAAGCRLPGDNSHFQMGDVPHGANHDQSMTGKCGVQGQLTLKTGSAYSSPRSSVGSYDSKSSSPVTSLLNAPFAYHGSTPSSVVSGHSSLSGVSLDSKQSSPRASITSFAIAAAAGDRFPGRLDDAHGRFDRFNEPSPPLYGPRVMTHSGIYLSHGPAGGTMHRSQITVPHVGRPARPHHADRGTTPPNMPKGCGAPTKLRGLHYEVIPPRRNGPSEAERKLAALTQQLEDEMSLSGGDDALSSPPLPPPYHGPHITGTYINCYPPPASSAPITVVRSTSLAALPTPGAMTPGAMTPGVTPGLPVHVTPPQHAGPTEAERKLEALTQELETQMEQNPQGDYYGEYTHNQM